MYKEFKIDCVSYALAMDELERIAQVIYDKHDDTDLMEDLHKAIESIKDNIIK